MVISISDICASMWKGTSKKVLEKENWSHNQVTEEICRLHVLTSLVVVIMTQAQLFGV